MVERGWRVGPIFEHAVDAVVLGQFDELESLLVAAPDLIRRRSAYGHRARCRITRPPIEVEIRRQVVPANAAEISGRLLTAGADPTATLEAYGGSPRHPCDAEIERAPTSCRCSVGDRAGADKATSQPRRPRMLGSRRAPLGQAGCASVAFGDGAGPPSRWRFRKSV